MNLSLGLPYRLLVTGSIAWVALVALAPWARQQGWWIAEILYLAFAPVCHQLPERSFFCFAEPFAVCHRCFGLYLGFTVGLLAMPWLDRLREFLLRYPRMVILTAVPMAIDVFLLPNTPLTRFLSGFVAAFPVSLFVWVAGEQIYRAHFRTTIGEPSCSPAPASSNLP